MMTKTKNIIFRRKTILKEKKIMNSTTKTTSRGQFEGNPVSYIYIIWGINYSCSGTIDRDRTKLSNPVDRT